MAGSSKTKKHDSKGSSSRSSSRAPKPDKNVNKDATKSQAEKLTAPPQPAPVNTDQVNLGNFQNTATQYGTPNQGYNVPAQPGTGWPTTTGVYNDPQQFQGTVTRTNTGASSNQDPGIETQPQPVPAQIDKEEKCLRAIIHYASDPKLRCIKRFLRWSNQAILNHIQMTSSQNEDDEDSAHRMENAHDSGDIKEVMEHVYYMIANWEEVCANWTSCTPKEIAWRVHQVIKWNPAGYQHGAPNTKRCCQHHYDY